MCLRGDKLKKIELNVNVNVNKYKQISFFFAERKTNEEIFI